ncbi:hypothetical protein QBC34DRAFT_378265 [Podospora aff. communis PSN243]|uniref:Copper transport protein n=1 Tax=Podospora aff. communis PSN243 TaxID=3040156 RepID=A0AAV9GT44_9PEZI|nr:hypothetical protein QBC34DRAFT_378265 [Podospora aff. communis PSN243]
MADITVTDSTAFPKIYFPPSSYQSVNHEGPCKMADMFWNWNTVGSCFVSRTWRIQSASMFAGTCIAVVLLAIFHEGFRFLGKFYDRLAMYLNGRYLIRMFLDSFIGFFTFHWGFNPTGTMGEKGTWDGVGHCRV